jgi:hypothetical protein
MLPMSSTSPSADNAACVSICQPEGVLQVLFGGGGGEGVWNVPLCGLPFSSHLIGWQRCPLVYLSA